VRLSSKPGEADRYASTNRPAFRPSRLIAEKEHFLCARWLPGGDVCAMQVHLPCSFGRGDAYLRQPAVPFDDMGDTRNVKTAIQFHDCTFQMRSPYKRTHAPFCRGPAQSSIRTGNDEPRIIHAEGRF